MQNTLKNWWQQRTRSEQRTLLGMLLLALPLLYWALFWDPLAAARERLRAQTAEQQATSLWLQQLQPTAQNADPAMPAGLPTDKSLLRLVDETLRARGMAAAIERIEPGQSEREVRIWLRDVSFDQMISWLTMLLQEHALSSRQLSVNQSSQQGNSQQGSGLVNARIDLAAE